VFRGEFHCFQPAQHVGLVVFAVVGHEAEHGWREVQTGLQTRHQRRNDSLPRAFDDIDAAQQADRVRACRIRMHEGIERLPSRVHAQRLEGKQAAGIAVVCVEDLPVQLFLAGVAHPQAAFADLGNPAFHPCEIVGTLH